MELVKDNVDGGVCLIIGTHPCWREDYLAAAARYPDHKICAVNFATSLTRADYIATVHGNLMLDFVGAYKHDNAPMMIQRDNSEAVEGYYRLEVASHGGSATFAAAAMIHLGYDLAILCGCPMTGNDGYAEGAARKKLSNSVWDGTRPRQIDKWMQDMGTFRDSRPDISKKIRSMSGNTKIVFGGIDDN